MGVEAGIGASLSLAGLHLLAHVEVERPGLVNPATPPDPDATIALSLAAYDRALDAKLGFEAARCRACGHTEVPAPYRCPECGTEDDTELVPLGRDAEVYSVVTVRTPVPGLPSPYSLAVIEVDGGVRLLASVTDCAPGSVHIGDRGEMVLRRVAVRAGVPDYGYAFQPLDPSRPDGDLQTTGATNHA